MNKIIKKQLVKLYNNICPNESGIVLILFSNSRCTYCKYIYDNLIRYNYKVYVNNKIGIIGIPLGYIALYKDTSFIKLIKNNLKYEEIERIIDES